MSSSVIDSSQSSSSSTMASTTSTLPTSSDATNADVNVTVEESTPSPTVNDAPTAATEPTSAEESDVPNIMHLYLPKVHFSVMDNLHGLFHECSVGKVQDVQLVPRLHNKDKSNCVMGFVTIEPYKTKEFRHLYGEMKREKNSPKMYYYDNRGQVKYVIVTINHTPNRKVEKTQKSESVMDIIQKQNKRIEALEALVAQLMKMSKD